MTTDDLRAREWDMLDEVGSEGVFRRTGLPERLAEYLDIRVRESLTDPADRDELSDLIRAFRDGDIATASSLGEPFGIHVSEAVTEDDDDDLRTRAREAAREYVASDNIGASGPLTSLAASAFIDGYLAHADQQPELCGARTNPHGPCVLGMGHVGNLSPHAGGDGYSWRDADSMEYFYLNGASDE